MTTEATEQAKKVTKPTTRNSRSAAAKKDTPGKAPQPGLPRGRFSPEQKERLLGQVLVDDGASWTAAAEGIGLRADTVRRWRQSEVGQDPAQQVRELERENIRLRQAVASLATKVADLEAGGGVDEGSELARTREALATMTLKVVEAGAS